MVRTCLLSFWTVLDPIYYMFTRLTYIRDREKNPNIFRVRLTRYKGRPIQLSDGTVINKNDILVKIHLHNIRLLNEMKMLGSDLKKTRLIYNHVKNGLPDLAAYISSHPRNGQIKGLIGITMLHKGCQRLGFETHEICNPVYRNFKHIVFLPMYLLSAHSISLSAINRPPKYLFMSKEQIIKKLRAS